MDGTRDRPPGKTAENWSRRDGIRAGAVTGPWRSAPREATSRPGPTAAEQPEAPKSEIARPEAQAAVAPSPQPAPAPSGLRTGSALGLKVWVAAGALAAIAIVLLAVVLRQSGEPPVQVAASPGATTVAAAPAEVQRPPSDPALAGVTSVRLRVGPDFPPERQKAILDLLAAAGITGVRVEALPFEIATSRVGYYRAEDEAAAQALGRVVASVVTGGAAVGVRDYGQLLADAAPGRLDLWVGG